MGYKETWIIDSRSIELFEISPTEFVWPFLSSVNVVINKSIATLIDNIFSNENKNSYYLIIYQCSHPIVKNEVALTNNNSDKYHFKRRIDSDPIKFFQNKLSKISWQEVFNSNNSERSFTSFPVIFSLRCSILKYDERWKPLWPQSLFKGYKENSLNNLL